MVYDLTLPLALVGVIAVAIVAIRASQPARPTRVHLPNRARVFLFGLGGIVALTILGFAGLFIWLWLFSGGFG